MFCIHPMLLPDALCFLDCECFRQEIEQVLRSSLGGGDIIVGMTDLFTKEHHLQIEVVEESGKVGTLIFESLSQFASRAQSITPVAAFRFSMKCSQENQ